MSERGAGRLAGKVAIVAGAGSQGEGAGIGTGRATAVLFAREGARVVIVDVNPAAAEVTAGLIGAEGGQCVTVTADVSRDEDCAAVTSRALEAWGRLDVLHHNVGSSSAGSVVDLPDEEWDRLMTVNVRTLVTTARHAVPAMAATGGGAIVTTSSISALRPDRLLGGQGGGYRADPR